MLNNQFEIVKTVVKPYYKYKQEAFIKIRKLAIQLLKSSCFFLMRPYNENLHISFGDDLLGNVPGAVNFFTSASECVLRIEGTKIYASNGKQMVEWGMLTDEQHDLLCNNLAIIFKARTNKTVPCFIESKIYRWTANKDYCEFVGANGICYINKG